MANVGGSIQSISLDGRNFAVPADADTQRKLGGFENEVQANGDGSSRLIKTRVPLMITGLMVNIDDNRGDHEYIQDLANLNDLFDFTITYASGITFQARVQIVGEFQVGNQATTGSIDIAGSGTLTRQ